MEQKSNRLGILSKRVLKSFVIIFASAFFSAQAETDPKYYAVMVSAQVQNSPAQIQLRWGGDANATGYAISRRNGGSWSSLASVGGSTTSWTDSNVSVGTAYEYRVTKSTSVGYTGTGYLYAGINAPLIENRGKVILLVDNTHAAALATELKRMEWDLVGDGWTVLRRDVARTDSVPNIKNTIRSLYNSDPGNVKAVFLFGRIPVPYSGNFNPDGHPDHRGAWPADVYYGDMDGNWTDSSTYSSGAQRAANVNAPGDGKFDQSDMPSTAELAVGRVDFFNMTCYANKTPSRSELDLLRAYLNKDHNFRHRVFTVARRGVVCDNFGERGGEAFASSGWRNMGAFFGAENVTKVAGWQYFPTVSTGGYLWSYGTGGGGYYTCDGVGSSDDFARTEIQSVFTMFLGSYFGDWDNESNFLRAPLGSGYCLTTSWAGRPHWFYHHMGLGETIGYSTLVSQNNWSGGLYDRQNYGTRGVHVALLGDPTLRMHPVIPASNLRGTASGSTMALTWSASSDTALAGYHVYRGTGPTAPFSRLTSSPVTGTSFTDTSYSSGATYMVRAVKLETAGGGTYYNASQGVFYPENGSGSGGGGGTLPSAPAAPANLVASGASASQINLTWSDNASNETGFRIERKTSVGGQWSQVATVGANSTRYSNTGLASVTTYYYRVFSYNDAGSSAPSDEATGTTSTATPTSAAASFIAADSATGGNWIGKYGSDGYNIITGPKAYPGYVQVTASGKQDYQWSDYTSETRALQTPAGKRIAGAWYSNSGFTIDLSFTDSAYHKFSLYFLDWDRSGREQRVEIIDTATGTVLDTQVVRNFEQGIYLSWNVKGSVRVRCTNLSGNNAVVMGLFFDPSSASGGGSASTKAGTFEGGKFTFQIAGQPGQTYDVFVSTNLSTWTWLSFVTLNSTTHNFLDNTSSGKALRFYRAVQVP